MKLSPLLLDSSEYSLNDAGKLIQESNEGRKALANCLISKHHEDLEKDFEERAQDPGRWLTSKWIAAVESNAYETIKGWLAQLAPVMSESPDPEKRRFWTKFLESEQELEQFAKDIVSSRRQELENYPERLFTWPFNVPSVGSRSLPIAAQASDSLLARAASLRLETGKPRATTGILQRCPSFLDSPPTSDSFEPNHHLAKGKEGLDQSLKERFPIVYEAPKWLTSESLETIPSKSTIIKDAINESRKAAGEPLPWATKPFKFYSQQPVDMESSPLISSTKRKAAALSASEGSSSSNNKRARGATGRPLKMNEMYTKVSKISEGISSSFHDSGKESDLAGRK